MKNGERESIWNESKLVFWYYNLKTVTSSIDSNAYWDSYLEN